MGAAVALTPSGSRNGVGTYRDSQQGPSPIRSHAHHGCCQDGVQAYRNGAFLGRPKGRTLVGTREDVVPSGQIDLDGVAAGWTSMLSAVAVPLRCRTNACPCCGPRLRRQRRARAFMGATGKLAMVTLTIDPSDPRWLAALDARPVRLGRSKVRAPRLTVDRDPDRAYRAELSSRYAAWAWNRLRTYLAREVIERDDRGRAVQRYGHRAYFRGLELQRSGMAHLHVLFRVRDTADFLALRSLLRGPEDDRAAGLAVRAGFGLVVDAQLARSRGDVARYVSKGTGVSEAGGDAVAYATKGERQMVPKYARQASWAQSWAPGWVKPTPVAGFSWRVADAHPDVVTPALVASGFVIDDPARFRVPAPPRLAAGG